MTVHVEMRLIGRPSGLQQFGRILDEGDSDLMWAGRHRRPELQVTINQFVVLIVTRRDSE